MGGSDRTDRSDRRGWVGRAVRRKEDERLLRGRGRFVADINLPGQVQATFVRSPFAHARILSVDPSSALDLPGVAAVLTPADVPPGPMPPFLWDAPPPKLVKHLRPELRPCHPPILPPDRVRFVGQAVAMVLATDRYLAEDAAERVHADYEPLPVAASLESALGPGAPVVHDGWEDNVACRFVVRKGDFEEAALRADLVVRERFEVQRQTGIPIETRGAVASFDPERGELTLWSGTQNAHPLRRAMSRVAGLPEDRVRVIAPDVGGGFGIKGVLYPEDLLVGLAAIRLGRPVKWVEDRLEHMQSAIHAREQVHEIELAMARDGAILGMRDRFLVDTGAFNPLGLVIPYNTLAHLIGPYRIEHFEAEARAVITNKTPTAPYRGAGRPEAVFAVERAIDRAAKGLGLDPVRVRMRNLIRPEEMPHDVGILYRDGEPMVLDSGDYPEALRRVATMVGDQPTGPHEGVGVAFYLEGTGIGPFEGANVLIDEEGAVSVFTGACAQGQSHATVFAQICADHLGVDLDAVTVVTGDTAGLERGWGTVASRSAVVAGNAIARAAEVVRHKVLRRASDLLEVSEQDLRVAGGHVSVAGAPERRVELGAVAKLAEAEGDPLQAEEYYEPSTVTWAYGAHAARVTVDPDTGEITILRYAVVHDCGTVINPVVVDGQVRGGVAQGIGGALFEQVVYNEDGQLLNGTLADYLVPTSAEVPPVLLDHLEIPTPLNPLGIKGVGEGGAVPPPAVLANAVEHALRDAGAVVRKTPLSPEYVRSLMREGTS